MKKCKRRPLLFWGITVVIGIGVTMGVLFPSGNDTFVPKSFAVAMRGKNLYYLIEQNNSMHKTGEKWCDPQTCSNATEFVARTLDALGANQKRITIDDGRCLWNVAIDPPETHDELFPMLISANFNPKLLGRTENNDAPLPIGPATGASSSLLGDKAIVLVRSNGSSEVIKAKYCTKKVILKTSCKNSSSATYLTPAGKIQINWAAEPVPPSPREHQP